MRRALVAAVIMSVALTGAAPAAHAKPKPRTLVVTVSGLPKGTAAKVRVKGPKKYHKVLSVRRQKAVKRLRPGVYRATVKPVRGYTARVKPRKARVTNKRGARLRISFTAEQPPEPEDDTLPTQPWPNLPGPQSITAVSTTASGVFGNDVSDFPSWSPDGTRIAFSSCATNLVAPTTGCYAYVKTLSNGSLAKLDKARLGSSYDLLNDWSGETQWARVGDKIAFTTMEQVIPTDTDEIKDIYTIDPLGATVTRPYPALSGGIVPLAESPRWSPTSDQLAFRSTAANLAGGTGEVYVTQPLSRLGTADPVAGLQWTPDGTALFYIAGDYTGDDDVPSTFDVFRQSPGGSPQRLTSGWQASFGQLSAAPDGRVAATTDVALSADDTNEAADIYATNGGAPTRLSLGPDGQQTLWMVTSPEWSPNGTKIAFVAESDEYGEVLLVKDLTSGRLTQITPPQQETFCEQWVTDEESGETYCEAPDVHSGQISGVGWSPDGSRIAFSSTHNDLTTGDGRWTQDVFVATL